jgi:uncharacterized protein
MEALFMGDSIMEFKDNTSNPAPLGLMGFGMTTVLLNLHNAGFFKLNAMILAMGVFYGGIGQVIAGIMEWKKNNTFGAVAFTSYGLFWLTFVGLVTMPKMGMGLAEGPDKAALIAYLVMWGIFTFGMFIGTLKLNRALQVIFGSLVILFFLLAIGDATDNESIKIFTGYEGIFCGLSAMYAAFAQILNEVYGKTILPVGPVKK